MRNLGFAIRGALRLPVFLVMVGCDSDVTSPYGCREIAVPAIEVTVKEVETGDFLEGALAVAQDGAFVDSARTQRLDDVYVPAALAYERAGTYSVSVEKDGYLSRSVSGVAVSEGRCHPNTARFTVVLSPRSE